jgi:hypothetical protein
MLLKSLSSRSYCAVSSVSVDAEHGELRLPAFILNRLTLEMNGGSRALATPDSLTGGI